MGNKITKRIPLWIKCPVAVLFQQLGELPLHVICCNMVRSYTQNTRCADVTVKQVRKMTQKTVYRYLDKRYGAMVERVFEKYTDGMQDNCAPIWIFWWQGQENAPLIIKSNISHIMKKAGNHPVHIVDATNFQNYVMLPPHILEKFQKGKISITHFSDYLRASLLYKHGGLWIDGSIFVRHKIPDDVFMSPIWTIRNPGNDEENISNWDWTIGVMGGWRKNTLFYAVAELLSNYWRDHDIPADYYVMDYMMKLVYEKSDTVKEWVHTVEPTNDQFYYLQNNANLPIDNEKYQKAMNSTTWLYKISWKGQYLLNTSDGQRTVYAQWQEDFGVYPSLGG